MKKPAAITQLSTGTLESDLTNLASAMVRNRANGLVLRRQANVSRAAAPEALATVLIHQQAAMRQHAADFLDRWEAEAIRVFGLVDAQVKSFDEIAEGLQDLSHGLGQNPSERSHVEVLADSFSKRFRRWLLQLQHMARDLDRRASEAERGGAVLAAALDNAIAAADGSDGPDGAIANVSARIRALRGPIDVNLTDVMLGPGATDFTSLVTPVLTAIGFGPSDARSEGRAGFFPVTSIDVAPGIPGELSAAINRFRTGRETLAAAYQALARRHGRLAVARAIGDQVGAYVATLRATASAVSSVARTTAGIQAGIDRFAREIADPAVTPATIIEALNAGSSRWAQLEIALRPIRRTLGHLHTACAAASDDHRGDAVTS